jgi:hypothetical protein
VGQGAVVCLVAAAAGALAGDIPGATLGAGAVAIPAALGAMALGRIGRQEASLMAAVALAAPCVRLTLSVALATGAWLAAPSVGAIGVGALGALSFWGAFGVAALGTLAVDTMGFAADFRALAVPTNPKTEAAGA